MAERTFHSYYFVLASIFGIYWGMSVWHGTLLIVHVENYRFSSLDAWLAPPVLCFLIGFLFSGRLDRITVIVGLSLYFAFAIGFVIGSAIGRFVPL